MDEQKNMIRITTEQPTSAELEEKLDQLKRVALPGKCPIRFLEADGEKIDWENILLREPYKSLEDVLKPLTATTDPIIAEEIFTSGLRAMPGKNVARNANLAVQSLADSSPRDATEARLCMQEMALYSQAMTYLSRAEKSDMLDHSDFYMKNAVKLLRLHNETIDARSKYKRDGEQRVVVQHVNVGEGAQAIVNNGNMVAGGGGKDKN